MIVYDDYRPKVWRDSDIFSFLLMDILYGYNIHVPKYTHITDSIQPM